MAGLFLPTLQQKNGRICPTAQGRVEHQ
jgi:hypothetical protein